MNKERRPKVASRIAYTATAIPSSPATTVVAMIAERARSDGRASARRRSRERLAPLTLPNAAGLASCGCAAQVGEYANLG